MKRYTKDYRTLHVTKFLNQKELNLKDYADKEGINPSTFRGWLADATSPFPIRVHRSTKKVTTKATTNLSSNTNTLTIAYSIIAVCTLILTCSYLWSLIVK